MYITRTPDVARAITTERIQYAEQRRLVKLAREARKDKRARAAAVATPAATVRRPRIAAIFAH
ncbi:MAG TPA: hypothetical protein VJ872_19200 [Nocardioides sp.]|nr:hypothetical protein [Nocardioides sp.]